MLRGPSRVRRRQEGLYPHVLGPCPSFLLFAILADGLLVALLFLIAEKGFDPASGATLLRGPTAGPSVLDLLRLISLAVVILGLLWTASSFRGFRWGSMLTALLISAAASAGLWSLSRVPTRAEIVREVRCRLDLDQAPLFSPWSGLSLLDGGGWEEARPLFTALRDERDDPAWRFRGAIGLYRLGDRSRPTMVAIDRGWTWLSERVAMSRRDWESHFAALDAEAAWVLLSGRPLDWNGRYFAADGAFWSWWWTNRLDFLAGREVRFAPK